MNQDLIPCTWLAFAMMIRLSDSFWWAIIDVSERSMGVRNRRVRNRFFLSTKKEMPKLGMFLRGMMTLQSSKTSSMSNDKPSKWESVCLSPLMTEGFQSETASLTQRSEVMWDESRSYWPSKSHTGHLYGSKLNKTRHWTIVITTRAGSCKKRKGGPHTGVCLDCTELAQQ